MPRWEPNASQRLADAALGLFEERGYGDTTVLDIATRAGLAKSTFFRHYRDKREVLFDEDALTGVFVDAITAAPAEAAPLEAIAHALDALGRDVFTPASRAFTVRRQAVVDANPDLQERETLKLAGLTAALARALAQRGLPDLTARATAELGVLAFKAAYERWNRPNGVEEFGVVARQALDEVQAAALATGERPDRSGEHDGSEA